MLTVSLSPSLSELEQQLAAGSADSVSPLSLSLSELEQQLAGERQQTAAGSADNVSLSLSLRAGAAVGGWQC